MKVQDTVVEIISEICSVDAANVLLESRLDNGLEIDEMRIVELVMALEDEFNIKIPECNMNSFETVGDITEYIERIKQ